MFSKLKKRKMKKQELVWIILFLMLIGKANGQDNYIVSKTDSILNLYNEVKDFIKTEKLRRPEKSAFYVYVVREIKQAEDCTTYSLGLIANEYDFLFIDADYYSVVDGSYVIITIKDYNGNGKLYGLEMKKVRPEEEFIIRRTLFDSEVGFMLFSPPGVVYKACDLYTEKQYYKNSDYIPSDFNIYSRTDEGEIKLIKNVKLE